MNGPVVVKLIDILLRIGRIETVVDGLRKMYGPMQWDYLMKN